MAEQEQEDNKKVAEDIGNSLGDTLKKAFSSFNKSQDGEWEGIFTRQKTLRDTLDSIKKSITSISPTADVGADMFSVEAIGKAVADSVPSADSLATAVGADSAPSEPSIDGVLTSAENLVEENKIQQESFSNSLTSIRDSITSAFPKIIENVKSSLSSLDPTADLGADLFSVDAIGQAVAESVPSAEAIGNAVGESNVDAARGDRVTQIEGEREAAKERGALKKIFEDIRDGIHGSLDTFKSRDKKSGGILAGLFGGIGGAGLTGLGKAVANIGMGFGKGMAALGAGIAAFIISVGVASKLVDLMGSDGKALKTLVINFFGAFDAKAATMMGGIITIAALMSKFKVDKVQFMLAMGAIGAGIGGFFGGLLLGDIVAVIGGAVGLKGESLAKLMKTFFSALGGVGAAMITSLVGIAAVIATVPGGSPKKLMQGMFAMGAGLAGFFGGVLLGDLVATAGAAVGIDGGNLAKLMKNFFGAFEGLAGTATLIALLGAGALVGIAGSRGIAKKIMFGMFAIGAGIGGFFGGVILADIGAKMALAGGFDGSNLAKLMQTFLASFAGVDDKALLVMGVLLAAGAIIGAKKGISGALGVAMGMTAIGAGLAGFFGGIIAAEAIASWASGEGYDGSKLSALMKTFMATFDGVSDKGLAVLGALLVVGAGIGMKGGISGAVKAAVGMTAIGAGIAGFFGGLAIAEVALKKLGDWTGGSVVDGSVLSGFMKNFMLTFDGVSDKALLILGGLLVAGAAMGVLIPPAQLAMVPVGMLALGAGIAGFFGGLALAEGLMKKIGDWTGGSVTDGSVLASFMTNFTKAMDGMSDKSLLILGGLLVAGAAIGVLLPGIGPLGVALGMTAMGAGIAGFFAGISLAGAIDPAKITNVAVMMAELGKGIGGFIGNLAGGVMKGFLELDADKLAKVGEGIKGLGIGMLAFTGSQAVGAVGGAMETVSGWFGSKSPLERIAKFADGISAQQADNLTRLGRGIRDLGVGLAAMGGADPAKISASVGALKEMDVDMLLAKVKDESDKTPGTVQKHVGGMVTQSGDYNLMKGEAVMTPSQLTNMAKTMELLVGSQSIEQSKSGGPPVIINNVDNSQKTAVSSNRATSFAVPTTPHNRQSTKQMLDEAYTFG